MITPKVISFLNECKRVQKRNLEPTLAAGPLLRQYGKTKQRRRGGRERAGVFANLTVMKSILVAFVLLAADLIKAKPDPS